MLEKSVKELAKQLIELKFSVKVKSIQMEDGSGRCFNVVHTDGTEKFYRLSE
jgi:wobble nucleotide-excising tRNase